LAREHNVVGVIIHNAPRRGEKNGWARLMKRFRETGAAHTTLNLCQVSAAISGWMGTVKIAGRKRIFPNAEEEYGKLSDRLFIAASPSTRRTAIGLMTKNYNPMSWRASGGPVYPKHLLMPPGWS